jgi:hypothetical protein
MGSKQRQRTPIEFRDLLLLIAEASNETRKAVNDQPV